MASASSPSICLDFVGAFSFNNTYTDAPNPSLNIEELGAVGFPLGIRDVEAIKLKVGQAPLGMVGKTALGESQRGVWEIDAKLVTFANPQWASFMKQTVQEMCKILAVNYNTCVPEYQPNKLLLYEEGSQILPHVDTGNADRCFATVMVVLPSEHTGGETHLSYDGVDVTYDCSKMSLNTTTVMAWYTGVTSEVKPIQAGYRLAVSFSLVHATNTLRPALSTNPAFLGNVKEALLDWEKTNGPLVPKKIVYLLKERYYSMRGNALEGIDKIKVSLLRKVAEEIGFSLGMATVVCRVAGYPVVEDEEDPEDSDDSDDSGNSYVSEDYYSGYGRRSRRRPSCIDFLDMINAYDNDVKFGKIKEREMSIQGFVDIDGTPISKNLKINESTESIPTNLSGAVEFGPGRHEDQKYHSYGEGGDGSFERWYRRTVVVIWPNKNAYDVAYPGDGLKYACDRLDKAVEISTELAEYVLSRVAELPKKALHSLCRAALRWKDYPLWARGVGTHLWHNRVRLLDNDDIEEAVKAFGFGKVCDSLEQALTVSSTNKGSLELIATLEEMMQKTPSLDGSSDAETVVSWAREKRDNVLRNLKQLDNDDVEIVIQSSISHDGAKFLKTRVMPQLLNQADPNILVQLAFEIHRSSINTPKVKAELVSKLVTTAIKSSDFFQPPSPPKPHGVPTPEADKAGDSEKKDPNLESLQKFVQICRDLGCTSALSLVLEKAKLTTGLEPSDAQKRAKNVILPLLARVREGSGTFPKKPVKELVETALPLVLSQPANEIGASTIRFMVNALAMTGVGVHSIQERLHSKFLSPEVSPDTQLALAEEIVKLDVASRTGTDDEGLKGLDAELKPAIDSLTSNFANRVDVKTVSSITSAIERCGKVGATKACSTVVGRVLGTAQQADAAVITKDFVPLLSPLFNLSQSITNLGDVGINPLLKAIIRRWVEIVLGQKPTHTTSSLVSFNRWTCDCGICQKVKHWLKEASLENGIVVYKFIDQPTVKHVKKQLSLYAPEATTTFSGLSIHLKPEGVIISFTNKMRQPLEWEKNRQAGIDMLTGISKKEQDLVLILGDYYKPILQALKTPVINESKAIAPGPQPEEPTPAPVVPASSSAGPSGSKSRARGTSTEERPKKRRKA